MRNGAYTLAISSVCPSMPIEDDCVGENKMVNSQTIGKELGLI
jgi:hypothetical protein